MNYIVKMHITFSNRKTVVHNYFVAATNRAAAKFRAMADVFDTQRNVVEVKAVNVKKVGDQSG